MRIGVVGAGSQGRKHARKLSSLGVKVFLHDRIREKAEKLSQEVNGEVVDDLSRFVHQVEGVIIATPATTHFPIADYLLQKNLPLLVEKPFVLDTEEAKKLVNLSRKKKIPLMVGMVERFHPGTILLKRRINRPYFIEIHRMGPFTGRGTDVGVTLDLMLHDLDLLWYLLKELPSSYSGLGGKVFTSFEDIVNVRLSFPSGCVANLTASRVSEEKMRKVRIFQRKEYYSLSFPEGTLKIYRIQEGKLAKEILQWERIDPLEEEIKEFLDALNEKRDPHPSAEEILPSLEFSLELWRSLSVVG